jgi:hypothetical protein
MPVITAERKAEMVRMTTCAFNVKAMEKFERVLRKWSAIAQGAQLMRDETGIVDGLKPGS